MISQSILADVVEATIGAGILSTQNILGGLKIIDSLKIISNFDFSEHRKMFSEAIGPSEEKMKCLIQTVPNKFDIRYAGLIDEAKLKPSRKIFKDWLLK